MRLLRNIWNSDDGQDLMEYALIAGLVALAAIATVTLFGSTLKTVWVNMTSNLATA